MVQDYTFISGPITVKRVLEEHHQQQFMRSGYRFRIIKCVTDPHSQLSPDSLAHYIQHLEKRFAKDYGSSTSSL
jgi:mannitol-1-phosphate/altronate dehydrogenase